MASCMVLCNVKNETFAYKSLNPDVSPPDHGTDTGES